MWYKDAKGDGSAYAPVVIGPTFMFSNITANGTTVVKTGTGILRSILINGLGTGTASVTIYNNTAASGPKIGTLNAALLIGPFQYDVGFTTGLTVVVASLLPPDITIIYI